jgi:hypothetical protein
MAIGTVTAITLGLTAAKIGSDVYASKKAAGAAKDAAKVQEKGLDAQDRAAREALALERGIYEQTRTDTAPWRNVGGQAVNSLGMLMGLPGGPVQGPNADPGPLVPSLSAAFEDATKEPPIDPREAGKRAFFEVMQTGNQPHLTGARFRAGVEAAKAAMTNANTPAEQASASGYTGDSGGVPIRTPSGRIVLVPADRVAEAESKGGIQLGREAVAF